MWLTSDLFKWLNRFIKNNSAWAKWFYGRTYIESHSVTMYSTGSICFAAFPHFHNPAQALDEMACVLKPGGELIIAHLRSLLPECALRITTISGQRRYESSI